MLNLKAYGRRLIITVSIIRREERKKLLNNEGQAPDNTTLVVKGTRGEHHPASAPLDPNPIKYDPKGHLWCSY